MSKLIILLVLVAAALSYVKADDENYPIFPNFRMFNPLSFGGRFPEQAYAPYALLNPDYIKNLQPGPGQTVSGAAVSSSRSSETVDGVTKTKENGRVVTNLNGKVTDDSY